MCFRRRRVGALIVIAAAAFTLVLAPASGVAGSLDACAQRVIRDWYSGGRIDDVYPLACYRAAIRALPDRRAPVLERRPGHPSRARLRAPRAQRPGEPAGGGADAETRAQPRDIPGDAAARGDDRTRGDGAARSAARHPVLRPSRTRPRRPSARLRSSPRPGRRRRPSRIRSSCSPRSRGSCSWPAASAGWPAAGAERRPRTGRITGWSGADFSAICRNFRVVRPSS